MASAIATLAIEDYLEIDPLVANAYGLDEGSNVGRNMFNISVLELIGHNISPFFPSDR